MNLDNQTDYGDNLVLTDLYAINNAGQIVAGGDTITPNGDIYLVLNPNTPPGPECPADFNESGTVTVQDVYDFLADWSSQSGGGPVILHSADFNDLDGVTVQDIYDFLAAWNAGCP